MLSSVACRDRSYRVVRNVQAPIERPFKEFDSKINALQTQAWRMLDMTRQIAKQTLVARLVARTRKGPVRQEIRRSSVY